MSRYKRVLRNHCKQLEFETGKSADALDRRPRLAQALAEAGKARCPVVVARLDRLSRDVAFSSGLMAQRVPLHRCRTWRRC
ncbi:recombinase family protein [Devosia enhydra]|uniref:recombinase family protein n=1 Tax=Devosia enhydra TaxID=665118 RepID=UPI00313EEA07